MPAPPEQRLPVFLNETAWYCIRTRPKQERITSQMLRSEIGIEVFSPFVRFKRARRGGSMWVTEALFPGYVFARFHIVEQWRHVNATRGVAKILSFGGTPAVVPVEVVSAVRASMPESEEVVLIPDTLQPGDEVSIVSGPYSGIHTIVTKVIPRKKAGRNSPRDFGIGPRGRGRCGSRALRHQSADGSAGRHLTLFPGQRSGSLSRFAIYKRGNPPLILHSPGGKFRALKA